MATDVETPAFEKERHVRYWLRNFKTLLPTAYTGMDSNRMFLAFMTLCSLDVLGVLHASDKITAAERAGAVEWLYGCQHPDGGFRGFPGTDLGHGRRNADNAPWDPANVAGTFFALASLVVLRDDLARVRRRRCLRWLRSLQAEDGSFAEILGPDGRPEGKKDVRYSYLAVATRHILALPDGEAGKDDIDRRTLADFVWATQSYDGGVGEAANAEAHGGFAYCAVVALLLLGEISMDEGGAVRRDKADFVDRLTAWLVSRRVYYEDGESEDDGEGEDEEELNGAPAVPGTTETAAEDDEEAPQQWVGFDGRPNKAADTCYTFWVGGTLCILNRARLIDQEQHRKFLIERTQHRVGGFGKTPGDLPDIMHSFLGLVALRLLGQPDLADVDPIFCMTAAARAHLERLRERMGDGTADEDDEEPVHPDGT